ncbi:MAG: C-GCAxxG-C-C family protein [Sarcina sp.]
MLIDKAKAYWNKKYDLNCAECIMYAANDEYNLNLSKETLKVMAAFGGGMAIESICGAATGAIGTIGIIYTNDRGHESPRVKKLTKEFMDKFYEELGTHKCDELKAKYKKDDVDRCIVMIESAAKVLDDIIIRERK